MDLGRTSRSLWWIFSTSWWLGSRVWKRCHLRIPPVPTQGFCWDPLKARLRSTRNHVKCNETCPITKKNNGGWHWWLPSLDFFRPPEGDVDRRNPPFKKWHFFFRIFCPIFWSPQILFFDQATVRPVAYAAKSPPVLAVDWWTIDLMAKCGFLPVRNAYHRDLLRIDMYNTSGDCYWEGHTKEIYTYIYIYGLNQPNDHEV